MQNISGTAEAESLPLADPRAELAAEISRLVTRILNGEAVDKTACGIDLAVRFPEAGLSGAMIAEAIDSAAGMVGLIREGATASGPAAPIAAVEGETLFDEELAAAIDADMDAHLARRAEEAAQRAASTARPRVEQVQPPPAGESGGDERPTYARGAIAAVRRAFFRG